MEITLNLPDVAMLATRVYVYQSGRSEKTATEMEDCVKKDLAVVGGGVDNKSEGSGSGEWERGIGE